MVGWHADSGRDYYVSLHRRGGHPQLFQLTPAIKAGFKKLVIGNRDLRDAVTLKREQLLELAALD